MLSKPSKRLAKVFILIDKWLGHSSSPLVSAPHFVLYTSRFLLQIGSIIAGIHHRWTKRVSLMFQNINISKFKIKYDLKFLTCHRGLESTPLVWTGIIFLATVVIFLSIRPSRGASCASIIVVVFTVAILISFGVESLRHGVAEFEFASHFNANAI